MSLGFIDIRWYSLAYIFAFILGSIIIKKIKIKPSIRKKKTVKKKKKAKN